MFRSIEIYNFLLDNCVGYDNRVKASYLMEKFHIEDHKTFRSYIESARLNPVLEYCISSEAGKNGGYWIATTKSEKNTALINLMARGEKMISNANILRKKKLYEVAKN